MPEEHGCVDPREPTHYTGLIIGETEGVTMANGSVLPPDIQAQVAAKRSRVGGIGAAAQENAQTAQQRETAMGVAPQTEEALEASVEEETEAELTVCPNELCSAALDSEWDYCAKCGRDLVREGPAKRLGLTFTDEDVQDYIFKGFIVRDLKVLGSHTATTKSSQPSDLHEIDEFVMNGEWAKNEDGSERKISEFYMRQMNTLAFTAAAVLKFDGKAIGETLNDRMKWLMERGSHLADLLSSRVIWYNQAVTKFLEAKDTFPGS
jgi:hypothetical protein